MLHINFDSLSALILFLLFLHLHTDDADFPANPWPNELRHRSTGSGDEAKKRSVFYLRKDGVTTEDEALEHPEDDDHAFFAKVNPLFPARLLSASANGRECMFDDWQIAEISALAAIIVYC